MQILGISVNNTEVNKLFCDLQEVFGQNPIPRIPHITVRGPQKNICKKIADKMTEIMDSPDFSITICGTDKFNVAGDFYVFLKIVDTTPHLKSVWRKPDYPISRYGYNPHITIYRGDKSTAERIEKKYANFHLTIKQKELSVYTKQMEQKDLMFD